VSDDRDWQHPAEHAAVNNHGFIMNPPPLAKRLVVLTATVSILASIAILFVAIPKGIDEYVDTAEATTTVPVVKGVAKTMMGTLTVGNITSCAVQIHGGIWIASSDKLGSATVATLSTSSQPSTRVLLSRSANIPYLVAASATPLSEALPPGISLSASNVDESVLAQSSVIDCIDSQPMKVRKSATQFVDQSELPVYVEGDVRGIAIVVGPDNSIKGLVCEHDHSQWLLAPRVVSELISTAR
jgi:hypothetical protein